MLCYKTYDVGAQSKICRVEGKICAAMQKRRRGFGEAPVLRASVRRLPLTLYQPGYAEQNGGCFHSRQSVLEMGFVCLSSLQIPELVRRASRASRK